MTLRPEDLIASIEYLIGLTIQDSDMNLQKYQILNVITFCG